MRQARPGKFKNATRWSSVEEITARAPLPQATATSIWTENKSPALSRRSKVGIQESRSATQAAICANASMQTSVCLDGRFERDFLVVLFMQDDELAGVFVGGARCG